MMFGIARIIRQRKRLWWGCMLILSLLALMLSIVIPNQYRYHREITLAGYYKVSSGGDVQRVLLQPLSMARQELQLLLTKKFQIVHMGNSLTGKNPSSPVNLYVDVSAPVKSQLKVINLISTMLDKTRSRQQNLYISEVASRGHKNQINTRFNQLLHQLRLRQSRIFKMQRQALLNNLRSSQQEMISMQKIAESMLSQWQGLHHLTAVGFSNVKLSHGRSAKSQLETLVRFMLIQHSADFSLQFQDKMSRLNRDQLSAKKALQTMQTSRFSQPLVESATPVGLTHVIWFMLLLGLAVLMSFIIVLLVEFVSQRHAK